MKTLVDTNVLLDIITQDPKWCAWSEDALHEAAERSTLVINPFVFAEVSMNFDRIEDANAVLVDFTREPLPFEAGFLVGKAFLAYRRRGGTKRSPMPDLYVGAHAAVARMTLLTREAARYRTYFPALTLIAPSP